MKTEKLFTMSKKELVELAKAHKIPGRSLAEKTQGTDALISLICLYMEANNIPEIGVAENEVEGTTEGTKREECATSIDFFRANKSYTVTDDGTLKKQFKAANKRAVNIPRNVVDEAQYLANLQLAVLYIRHIQTVDKVENLQKAITSMKESGSSNIDRLEQLEAALQQAHFEEALINKAYPSKKWDKIIIPDDVAYLHAAVMVGGNINLKGIKDIQSNLLDLFKKFTDTLEKSILAPEVCNNISEAKECLDLVRGEFEKYFDLENTTYKRYKWNIKNSDLITLYRESGYIDATGECGEKFKDEKVLTKRLAYFILARLGAWTAPAEK